MTLRSMAALFIRTIGTVMAFYGVFNVVLYALFDPWALGYAAYSLRPYLALIFGVFLISKSRSLAKILCRGLENF